jgi:hypothetical protein
MACSFGVVKRGFSGTRTAASLAAAVLPEATGARDLDGAEAFAVSFLGGPHHLLTEGIERAKTAFEQESAPILVHAQPDVDPAGPQWLAFHAILLRRLFALIDRK